MCNVQILNVVLQQQIYTYYRLYDMFGPQTFYEDKDKYLKKVNMK